MCRSWSEFKIALQARRGSRGGDKFIEYSGVGQLNFYATKFIKDQ
jgi:hypothetical protein